MKTVAVLFGKDLRRAWRNPVGWLVFLAIPLAVTGLVGAVFGPKSGSNILGRVRFALVDDDDSPLTRFLRGAVNQGQAGEHLEPVFLTRDEALRQITNSQLSALVVIPAGFTSNYLSTTNVVTFELVKNPAEAIRPAVLEELLGVVVAGLDAVKRNFSSDLAAWQEVFEGGGDYRRVAELIVRAGDKVKAARQTLSPLRVTYVKQGAAPEMESTSPVNGTKGVNGPASKNAAGSGSTLPAVSETGTASPVHETKEAKGSPSKSATGPGSTLRPAPRPAFNIFGYLLPGMASMFLLFLAENASRDLYREIEQRTLQRFSTLHTGMQAFVVSKLLFSVVFLLVCAAVLLAGGGLIFRITWQQPVAVVCLTAAYCFFAAGLMMLLPVMLGNPSVSQAIGNVVAMLIGMAGGSAFPAERFPAILRKYLTGWLPNYWYTEAMRALGHDPAKGDWALVALKIAVVGLVLVAAAAWLLRRGLERGMRA